GDAQRRPELRRAWVTLLGLHREGPGEDGLDLVGNAGAERAGGRAARAIAARVRQLRQAVAHERGSPTHRLAADEAQCEDVRPGPGRAERSRELLRRAVRRRKARDLAARLVEAPGQVLRVLHHLRDSEVEELHLRAALARVPEEEHVAGLDVTVRDPLG